MDQVDISGRNSEFWDELCGTQLAQYLGITDSSPSSLKKFDDWYFDFYPYLFEHIPFGEIKGKKVLEIGLGYGTVSQRMAESNARYQGLDIARGPVEMVNLRLHQASLSGGAIQGNILDPPFDAGSFDMIVAIGCLHHTGDLKLAIKKCYEMLRPGGRLIFMVYYAYSYRRYRLAFGPTISYMMREITGYRGVVGSNASRDTAAYDTNSDGTGAPHTDWISIRSMKELCREFSSFEATLENIDQEKPFAKTPRKQLLLSKWPRRCGLDLYVTATR